MTRRRLVAGYAALLLGLWFCVARWTRLDRALPSLATEEQAAILAALRSGLDGGPALPPPAGDWSGVATLWCGGEISARGAIEARRGRGIEAAAFLAQGARVAGRDRCRIKVDVLGGRGRLVTALEPLFAFSLIPGVDGLGARFGSHEELLLPDELLRADLFGRYKVAENVDFDGGLDGRAAINLLARRVGRDGAAWRASPPTLFRFRTLGFIEAAQQPGAALATFRGGTAGPPPTRANLRGAAIAGGDYLLAHQHSNGRFDYEYFVLADQATPIDGGYALPRHAGATWFLAQLATATGETRFLVGARRAIELLGAARPAGCAGDRIACVGRPEATGEERVDLGSSALALLAVLDLPEAGGVERAAWRRGLVRFLLDMQRADGEFAHLFTPATGVRDERTRLLYFSGEAALALARVAVRERNPEAGAAAQRAVRALTEAAHPHLADQLFFGEEHWTCMAVDEAWPILDQTSRRIAGDFCEAYADFLARQQFRTGEALVAQQPDLVGASGFSGLFAPHVAPVGSRSETLISIHHLALQRGHDDHARAIAEQVRAAAGYLLGRQIRDDNAWLAARPEAARGGFLQSDSRRVVRIDFLQHVGSALLRGEALAVD